MRVRRQSSVRPIALSCSARCTLLQGDTCSAVHCLCDKTGIKRTPPFCRVLCKAIIVRGLYSLPNPKAPPHSPTQTCRPWLASSFVSAPAPQNTCSNRSPHCDASQLAMPPAARPMRGKEQGAERNAPLADSQSMKSRPGAGAPARDRNGGKQSN